MSYHIAFDNCYVNHGTLKNPQLRCFDMDTHSTYELLYLLNGDITEVIEDRKYKLKKHDLVIIRPGNYHFIQVNSPADYERFVIYIDADQIDNISLISPELEVLNCRHKPNITELFKRFDYYHRVMDRERLRDIFPLMLKELIFNLSIAEDSANSKPPESIHPLASKALAEINENLFTIRNIGEVAHKLFVTESYLYRIFKQELKTTPLKYITEKRLHAAQSLLAQGKPPTYVYRECGFNDYTSFYRSYVKLFGHSPSK